jgi:hypothetical protein
MLDRRTTFQLALFAMGVITWGYGQRIDDASIRLVGIAFFAVATTLRFFRRSDTKHMEEPSDETEAE